MSHRGATHHRKVFLQVVCVLLALPFLYVAGSGPLLSLTMKWNGDQGIMGKRMLEIYRPLLEMEATNPLDPAWRAYLGLWGLHPFRLANAGSFGPLIILESLSPGEHRRYYSPSPATPATSTP